ncbi:hypothetical protein L6R52_36870 [Myxococcota bacterium]|nr:hypothetical protein [Myxococcota bacterium]
MTVRDPDQRWSLAEIREALGSSKRKRALAAHLDPLVRAPVRYALRRWARALRAQMDEDDVTSSLFELLFADGGRVLLAWDESRGSLETYVSVWARSRISELERKEARRRELVPRPTVLDEQSAAGITDAPDGIAEARQLAEQLRACLGQRLGTDRAREMLALIFDRDLDTDEIEALGHDRPAIFRWRSAIMKAARECLEGLRRGGDGEPKKRNGDVGS